MAQLSSPGVSVTVIDESFYTPAAPGTVPLIVVASAENKANSAGTGTAPGTLKANAGKVYLLTSQMDLGTTFGIPYFQTDANNNPVHAGEINEYGLQAAYSFLGVSNRAYVVRADLDLSQLKASATAPAGLPVDGKLWLSLADTTFGVFQWNSDPGNVTNGQTFRKQTVKLVTSSSLIDGNTMAPISSYGAVGDYAMVVGQSLVLYYKKPVTNSAAGWVAVGSPEWAASWPTVKASLVPVSLDAVSDTLTINSTPVTGATSVAALATNINSANITGVSAYVDGSGYLVINSTGANVVVAGTAQTKLGFANGTYLAPKLSIQDSTGSTPQTTYSRAQNNTTVNGRPSGSLWIKSSQLNGGANWDIKRYSEASGLWVRQPVSQLYPTNEAAIFALDPTGGIGLAVGTVYVKYNTSEAGTPLANFAVYARTGSGVTSVTTTPITNSTFTNQTYDFTVSETVPGQSGLTVPVTVSFTGSGSANDIHALVTAFQAALNGTNIAITINNTDNSVTITHQSGGDIRLVDGAHTPLAHLGLTPYSNGTGTPNFYADPTGTPGAYQITQWSSLVGTLPVATASSTAPVTLPSNGRLWYNSVVDEVDIMIHNGTTWVGYLNYDQSVGTNGPRTDPNGPIVSATQPKTQSDGTELGHGDLWIDTSDLENYPLIHKFNYFTKKWVLLDNADQTTHNGVLFHDARSGTSGGTWDSLTQTGTAPSGTIKELLSSNFLDFDAPDPALYPEGMLLWNLRRSGNNVLQYVSNYVDQTAYNLRQGGELQATYYPHRWISDAPNKENGAGSFGRHAQRAVVVKALNALIADNQQIRDEDSRQFNLMSCPGYLETLPALNALNADRGLMSFIVADTPARLRPDATSLSNWGNNVAGATGDGEDGMVSTDPYSAVYYPWGYTTDLLGNNIVVPPSHIMLRTIALSDNVSYPWFAPAGTRRGGVNNASSVGYVNPTTGEFETVALNTGQRDTLAAIHVNPITYIGGIGLVAYGQKTRQLVASSLDRINVARLVIYLRYQLNQIAKPYIFEPNDTITRNEIKQQIESMMLELTGQRALYDYLVVCDTSNNTPARIDRSELHVDIAIEPVKAVEFIYIPLRLENTGAIKGLGQ